MKYSLAEKTKLYSAASSTSPVAVELGAWNEVTAIVNEATFDGSESWQAVKFGKGKAYISGATKVRPAQSLLATAETLKEKAWNVRDAFREFERNSYTEDELSGVPLSPYLLRYFLIGLLTFATCATVTFLGGLFSSLFGGELGTPGGDVTFGIGCFVAFWIGLVLSIPFRVKLIPKRYKTLQEKRDLSVFKGLFCSAIVGVGIGIEIAKLIYHPQAHSMGNLALSVLIMCSAGAIPTTLCAVGWMAIEDRKNKNRVLEFFREWKRQTSEPATSVLPRQMSSTQKI